MRATRALMPTLRETPAEAEVVSHQLMLRAGYIRQVARGIYTYLPLGWRVLRKIEAIVREELDRIGCEELQMPCVIPAELWQQSGRWQAYGKELLRFKDRHDREFCFGPTHEEIITPLVASLVRSYRDLPKNLYQIHTKFRDEIRPRFGLMRGREFLMKDAYSFHADDADLDREYRQMCKAYQRIFARCGLDSRIVEAATGNIGGASSHEVMILAETGESEIAHCACGYAANVELAACRVLECPAASTKIPPATEVHTPGLSSCEEVAQHLQQPVAQMLKTLIYLRDDGLLVVVLPGDHILNEHKLQTAVGAEFVTLADATTIRCLTGADVGFSGPIGLPSHLEGIGTVTVLADWRVQGLTAGTTGANKTDYHCINVQPGRDFTPAQYVDLSTVRAGDPCPCCTGGRLQIIRGIEVGHVFKLGTKYSAPFAAKYLDAQGAEQLMPMGCYGLGIGRTAAAAIEQHHDARGIMWPLPIAPYHVTVLLLNSKDAALAAFADQVYAACTAAGLDVLYDDRAERAGVKFADAELIGIPYQIIVGAKGLATCQVELKERRSGEARLLAVADAVAAVQAALHEAREGASHGGA